MDISELNLDPDTQKLLEQGMAISGLSLAEFIEQAFEHYAYEMYGKFNEQAFEHYLFEVYGKFNDKRKTGIKIDWVID